jgi:polyribonucleotide nucleotidyltransferase
MPTVISADMINDPDTIAMVAASAAVAISDIPFEGPIAAVRVGRVDGKLIANPTLEQMELSDVEIVVSGSKEAVMMVEGESNFFSEAEMLDAIFFGHESLQPLIDAQA